MQSIYNYLSFRDFVKDRIQSHKKDNPHFSLRSVAYRIDCDPGLFSKILKGVRSLTAEAALKLAEVLHLNKRERIYFETLVKFNQARSHIEKEHFFEYLNKCKNAAIKTMAPQQYAMYDHWYYAVLRDLLHLMQCRDGVDDDLKKAANLLMPSIKPDEARKAVEVLKKLGIIKTDENGILQAVEKFITSGVNVPQVVANRFLIESMDLARRAIDLLKREERSLSTLTFSVSAEGYEKIKRKIDETRSEILALVDGDNGRIDRVCHCNFHLFPVTHPVATE